MMKRFLILTACLLAFATVVKGFDFDPHMRYAKMYRVNLGSDRAPNAGEFTTNGFEIGTFIVNTYDNKFRILLDSSHALVLETNGTLTYDELTLNNLSVLTNISLGGNLSFAGDGYFEESQDGYIKIHGAHLVSGSNGAWNIGSSTQMFGYAYFNKTIQMGDLSATNGGTIVGDFAVSGTATAGTLVVTSGSTLPAHDIAVGELPAMTDGQVFVGDTTDSNVNVVAMSGDATIGAAGALTISARAVEGTMMPAATDGQVLVGVTAGGSNVAAATISGDATLATGGALTISARAVEVTMLPAMTTGQILVGNTGDSNAIVRTMSGVSVDTNGLCAVDATVLTGNIADARLTNACPLKTQVFGSADVTIDSLTSGKLITTNAIDMLDVAGTAKAGYALTRVWTSQTQYGEASTQNVEALTLSLGSAVATETANADYWYVTSSGGDITATITATATNQFYLNVSVGENVASELIELAP